MMRPVNTEVAEDIVVEVGKGMCARSTNGVEEIYPNGDLNTKDQIRKFHENVAAVKIQAAVRRMLCRFDYVDAKMAAEDIQTFTRKYFAHKLVAKIKAEKNSAAKKIQTCIR